VSRTENQLFFPQDALDRWIVDASVELQQGELSIVNEGRRFKLTEAVRILREVSGAGDAHELLGRVKTRAFLEELGAEIVEHSMLLGDAAYDVEPGWLGAPQGSFAEHMASEAARKGPHGRNGRGAADIASPRSDEELLAQWLGGGT
jgi:hypothetical protein